MNSSASFAFNIAASNIQRLHHPYKLTFAVTYRCNSRCAICNIWKKPHKDELSLREIQLFFQKNTYFNWVNLTGGELILRNDIIPIFTSILRTQTHLLFINFPTNGLLTNKIVKRVQEMLLLRPPHLLVSVSLDGPKQLHDRLRGIEGNWQQAVQTYVQLKQLRSSRFDCYFAMTLSKYNYSVIEKTYRTLKNEIPNLRRSDIHFNIAHQSEHYYGNEEKHLSLKASVVKAIDEYNKRKNFTLTKIALIERIYQNLIRTYIETKKTPIPCLALSSSVFLDPYGNIFPCTMWNYPLGNLKDHQWNLLDMWNTKMAQRALELIRTKHCSNCWTPCEAYQSTLGNLHNPTIYNALFTK